MRMPERRPMPKELQTEVQISVEKQKNLAKERIDIWTNDDPLYGAEYAALAAKDIIAQNPSREAIPGIFRHAFDSIGQYTDEESANAAISHLFDIVRSIKEDPALREVLLATMAYDVHPDRIRESLSQINEDSTSQQIEDLLETIDSYKAKQDALEEFSRVAAFKHEVRKYLSGEETRFSLERIEEEAETLSEIPDEDNVEDVINRRLAEAVLSPSKRSEEFLQNFNPDSYTLPANIATEQEIDGFSLGDLTEFTGRKMRLSPGKMPSAEKVALYQEKTGRILTPSITYLKDGKKTYLDIDPDSAVKAFDIGHQFKKGIITESDRDLEMAIIMDDFMQNLNDQQRAEIGDPLDSGVELRFSTERGKSNPELAEKYREIEARNNERILEAQQKLRNLQARLG